MHRNIAEKTLRDLLCTQKEGRGGKKFDADFTVPCLGKKKYPISQKKTPSSFKSPAIAGRGGRKEEIAQPKT